jgi:hypothetical protein
MVLDPIGIEIHAFYRGSSPAVVIGAECVIQQKFGLSFRTVDFEREHSRGSNQDSILTLLRDHEGALLDSEAAAKFGRQHHGATTADSASHCSHSVRIADILNIEQMDLANSRNYRIVNPARTSERKIVAR